MLPSWLQNGLYSFDTETTGPDPTTARIVSADIVEVGPAGVVSRRSWLINPDVEIPSEATAIHGITNEKVKAEGKPPQLALMEIGSVLVEAFKRGLALCVFNASYDITVMHAEAVRHGVVLPIIGPIIDPMVVDRAMSKRAGKRDLQACAEFYGVKADTAHNSEGDALTAARVLWKQAKLYPELARLSLNELQQWQAEKHKQDVERFRQWLREETGRLAQELERRRSQLVSTDTGWPTREAAAR